MRTSRLPALALLAALALAGCGGGGGSGRGQRDANSDPGTSTAPPASTTGATGAATAPPATPPSAQTRTAVAYLLRDGKVAPVTRQVPHTQGVAAAALRALLQGPTAAERAAGLSSALPAGTALREVSLAGGVATVQLDAAGHPLDRSAVAQVVYTATSFPTVQRVALRLGDDAPQRTLGRADLEDLTPSILVETPLPGDLVPSPLQVSGTANTFEATFVVEVLDAGGRSLGKQTVTATSGSGTRGTFAVSVPFQARAGAIVLRAYEPSAEDGRPLHEVRIPLRAG